MPQIRASGLDCSANFQFISLSIYLSHALSACLVKTLWKTALKPYHSQGKQCLTALHSCSRQVNSLEGYQVGWAWLLLRKCRVATSDYLWSFLRLEMVSRISCSTIFPGDHLKLVGLLFCWCSFLTFWKIGVTLALFQSWGTFPIAMVFQRLSRVDSQRHQSALSLVKYVRPICLCAP